MKDLAFIDLETTGLGPTVDRVAEIGVVTLDEDGAHREWQTLVNPGRPRGRQPECAIEGVSEEQFAAAPRFGEIAGELKQRLRGRLLVAHNARFDYAFLKSEFARAGVRFEAPALCTVMLSRKLYPGCAGHNLDSLIERHGLTADIRHRALPDARVLHQFWQVVGEEFPAGCVWATVDKLLAEPVLPPHVDLDLVDALPQKPGVYVMRGEGGRALRIGRAANLRREVRDYFRLDRISAKGAKVSYKVRNIEWQVAEGDLAARLLEISVTQKEAGADRPRETFSLRLEPASQPQIVKIVPAAEVVARGEALFGLYDSQRKADNALRKLADRHGLCHGLLGLARRDCSKCESGEASCARARAKHLVRAVTALSATRIGHWPYAGPAGVSEGNLVHVFDQWQHLGSARTAPEIADLAQARPRGFDADIFRMLVRTLPRLRGRRVKTLGRR